MINRNRLVILDAKWTVVGTSKELIGPPSTYVNSDYLSQLIGEEGYARSVVVSTSNHDSTFVLDTAKQLEQKNG